MRKSLVSLAVGLFAFSGVLSASAYADCGSFDQLMQQQAALQSQVTLGANSDCSNKPDESAVDSAISCIEGLQGLSPRNQSDADLALSGLYGMITQCYTSGIDQQAPGKKSFNDLVAATEADPTYEKAWLTFAQTVAGMAQQGWFARQAIQMGLGISIDDEVQTAINGLQSLPQDAAVTSELAVIRAL